MAISFDIDKAGKSSQPKVWVSELEKYINESVDAAFPKSPTSDYNQYYEVLSDSAVVIGDAEVPDHDSEIFSMVADVAHRFAIDTLIINGDFFDAGKFSTWKKTFDAKQLLFDEEIQLARTILSSFLKFFDRIFIIPGNHEDRISKLTSGAINFGHFIFDLENVFYSPYNFLDLKTSSGTFAITHGKSYSRIPLATARKLAGIYNKSIIIGHSHHLGMTFDPSGNLYLIDGGCCRDIIKTQYKSMSMSTFPQWVPGFVVIKKGIPILFSKKSYPMIYF